MDKKEWKIPFERPELPGDLTEAGYGPLLAAVLALRGIRTVQAAQQLFSGGPELLEDPFLMNGMQAAVERLNRAIRNRESLAVYGDYDVDGITATCLLTSYFRGRGLRCLPYIPDRNEEGYGLNCAALDTLRQQGVSLLVTVDCGITAVEEVDHAEQIGLDMIITDHHECKNGKLPKAVAVIDCKQPGNRYPNQDLAGVGVAMKLACALEGSSAPILEQYADLVAVGTVADVMPLTGENRFLVRRGLQKLEQNPLPGFSAMLKEAGVDPRRLTASIIGFSLAPRLNAAGRLGQAQRAADLLMCADPEKAATFAAELCDLNRQRQSIEMEIWQDAQNILASEKPDGPIILADDRWHQGVIGIAASRLADQFSLPAIMICFSGDTGKGSCRSCGGFNLYDALCACSRHLIGFGGHALAAGLTIRRDKLEDFRRALNDYYQAHRPEPQPEVQCDLLIRDPSLLSIENVRELDRLEPYGNANAKPVFCMSDVELEQASTVGGGRHLRIRVRLEQSHFDGIFFGHTLEQHELREGDRVDLAFCPQINEFRGHTTVQLLLSAIRRHDPSLLCGQILADREISWAALPYRPQRADFVRLWRKCLGDTPLAGDLEGILSGCPRGMEPERYCLCLMALMQSGLLDNGRGGVFGAQRVSIQGKADLDATPILSALRRAASEAN